MEIGCSTTTDIPSRCSACQQHQYRRRRAHLSGFRMALTRTITMPDRRWLVQDVKDILRRRRARRPGGGHQREAGRSRSSKVKPKANLNSDIGGVVQAFINERLAPVF